MTSTAATSRSDVGWDQMPESPTQSNEYLDALAVILKPRVLALLRAANLQLSSVDALAAVLGRPRPEVSRLAQQLVDMGALVPSGGNLRTNMQFLVTVLPYAN